MRRAVVVGASMAGLCAARVLSERFDQVQIIDRDRLPDQPQARSSVPQGQHPHLLLYTGARLLEGWFPGIIEELTAGGAPDIDIVGDFYWHQHGGVQRRPSTTMRGPSMSRPFLEHAVRRHVAVHPRIILRSETRVVGLDAGTSGDRIRGVRLDDGTTVGCDLVVDATGRQARSLGWLEQLGYPSPKVEEVGVDTRYVSREYRRDVEPTDGWRAAVVIGDPDSRRLAMALPIEGRRWLVSLPGVNGESAPTDDAGMLAYARSLGSPVIADVITRSEPIGDPVTYRFVSNQRRRVERLRRFPLGWVMLGDAVCSFNPIYGQGMTSAAQQAAALGQELDRAGAVDRRFARRFFRAAGRIVGVPWSIAIGGDFVYAGTTGSKPPGTDLVNRYMARVTIAGQHDDAVVVRFNEVVVLLRPPGALMAPSFMLRVLRASRHRTAGPTAPQLSRAGS